ncbi:MAG: hypothetical protein ACJA0V_004805 [Planctomycetota bacterium]|jgi:hypothetical protein
MTPTTLRSLSCLALALVCSAPAAQDKKFAPRDFMIPNYENLMFVDIKAMRDREIWDELESSVMNLAFTQMERELGFPIEDLDRISVSMAFGGAKKSGMSTGPVDTIRIFEGNKPLPVHESMAGNRWQREQIGDYEVWRRKNSSEDMFVQPCDTMQVWGTSAALQPALQKKRVALPSAEIMSFLSGRDATLACFVFGLNHPQTKQRFLADMLGGGDWPEDDMPQLLGARLLATGDEDDPHLTVEAVLRHQKAGDGIKVTEALSDGLLEKFRANPQMRLLRPLLKKVVKEVDGTDLVLRLDLGRVRNAVGHLATLALPMFMGGEARSKEAHAREKAAKDSPPKEKKQPKTKPAKQVEAGGGKR